MFVRSALLAVVIAFGIAGCDKPTPENLDKWTHTEKGPDKLKKAFGDDSLDPEISAHAAANLVRMQQEGEVRKGFELMDKSRREAVIGKLAPKLWDMAKVDREDTVPSGGQVNGKDMLVAIEKWAAPADKATIDGYLVDWYGVKSYEARAEQGAHLGGEVMRLVGPAGGKKLVEVLNGLLAAPGQDKTKNRIGDNLMLGIAASGDPDGIKKLIEVARMDRGDPTLANRAMSALWTAYVSPNGLFDLRAPDPLIPNLPLLAEVARDDKIDGAAANHAVDLIGAVGAPACIAPLVSMVAYPTSDPVVKYQGVNKAIRCAGVKGVKEAVEALPPSGAYDKADVTGAISGEIAKLQPKDQALAAARDLLTSQNPVARWVGVEALGAMKSTDDAAKVAALEGDKTKLTGYWGEGASKPDPTLGDRAKEVATQLQAK
jgi:hypothetical protein|nr:hypothetical protein [Kofleriaceae bacterium]